MFEPSALESVLHGGDAQSSMSCDGWIPSLSQMCEIVLPWVISDKAKRINESVRLKASKLDREDVPMRLITYWPPASLNFLYCSSVVN